MWKLFVTLKFLTSGTIKNNVFQLFRQNGIGKVFLGGFIIMGDHFFSQFGVG